MMTERQLDILRMVSNGYSHKEVAAQMKWSDTTVAHELERVRKVLGARSTTEAVAMAIRAGHI